MLATMTARDAPFLINEETRLAILEFACSEEDLPVEMLESGSTKVTGRRFVPKATKSMLKTQRTDVFGLMLGLDAQGLRLTEASVQKRQDGKWDVRFFFDRMILKDAFLRNPLESDQQRVIREVLRPTLKELCENTMWQVTLARDIETWALLLKCSDKIRYRNLQSREHLLRIFDHAIVFE